jgi:pantoate--beta-alanine ligase
MLVLEDIDKCRTSIDEVRRSGQTVGLVPTMGALHKGHLSLIHAARERCDFVAVTIFVNPTQFGPGEDYESYPRTREADLLTCERAGVDVVFMPSETAMYPEGAKTTVHVREVSDGLCGAGRPGHFDGVATICTKLFNILPAHQAFFGEKDYQQMVMIRRMVRDLDQPIEIVACPTVREPDGLAMSSRNAYLSASEREQAAGLSRGLFAARDRIVNGERDATDIVGGIRDEILSTGSAGIEYIEVVDPETLASVKTITGSVRICLAVRIGRCRLIDNVGVVL